LGIRMYIESVTSALIRASRALCLPAAVLYVGKCTVAALCQEESFPSQNLDSPSARAKGDCFIGLCLQVGPCSGHQIPCGDFRDTEGERRTPLVCTALDGSPPLSLHSLPLRSCSSGSTPVAQGECRADKPELHTMAPSSPKLQEGQGACHLSPLHQGSHSSSEALVAVGVLCQGQHRM